MPQRFESIQALEPRRLLSAVQLSVLSSIPAGASAEIVAHDPRTQRSQSLFLLMPKCGHGPGA